MQERKQEKKKKIFLGRKNSKGRIMEEEKQKHEVMNIYERKNKIKRIAFLRIGRKRS